MEPLVVLVESSDGLLREHHAFIRSPVRIGRSRDSDLPLPHPFVSARHGLVQFDEAEAWYQDLGSRNGSLVSGTGAAPRAPVALGPGAEVRIGPLRLTFARRTTARAAGGEQGATVSPGQVTALMERLARTPEPVSAEAWAASLHAGMVVGRFELLREIGRGGFGVVFEALDRQLGRRVAFKAVKPGAHADARAGDAWLQREAEAAARLCHPNIVTLHDCGTWDGGAYLILELLRGENLAERLARSTLGLGEAVRAATDVGRALAHAHAEGVLHRDLKPANVFLARDGFTKVLDFGLAQFLGGEPAPSGGTPQYMAPEQRRGEPLDPRADVFAAALVLQESLTGRIGEAGRPLPLPSSAAPLAPLLAAGLAGDRARRPADGKAWLDGLLAAERAAGALLWEGG